MRQQQHGDVLICRVDEVPSGAKKVKSEAGYLILAEGETTGHAHRITDEPGVELYEAGGVLYLSAEKQVEVTHEEHHTQTIDPGIYEIGRVVEVDPFEDAIREVAD